MLVGAAEAPYLALEYSLRIFANEKFNFMLPIKKKFRKLHFVPLKGSPTLVAAFSSAANSNFYKLLSKVIQDEDNKQTRSLTWLLVDCAIIMIMKFQSH